MSEESTRPRYVVIDLAVVRESLCIPTLVFAGLARRLGATVSVVSPGNIEITDPDSDVVVHVHVKRRNEFADEARSYRLAGLPVPAEVLRDMEEWYRKYGR